MSDFESRLRDALSSAASSVDAVPPAAEPMLAAADARRERRRSLTGAGAGLVVLLLMTVVLVASGGGRAGDGGRAGGTPVPTQAQLASRSSVTTSSVRPTTTAPRQAAPRRSASTATTGVPVAPSTTGLPAAVSTTTTTTTTAVDPRPLAQRVPAGLWIVGLDGAKLRRVADAGRYAWSPDGTMLAVATDRIAIVSAADGHEVASLDAGPKGTEVGCVDWASTGTLGWVSADGRLRFARMEDRSATVEVGAKPVLDGGWGDGCSWSPDGSRFATAGDGFAVYDTSGRRLVVPADAKAASVARPRWSPDGRTLAALSWDRDGRPAGVALLSLDDAPDVAVVAPGDGDVVRVVWSADGRRVLARTGGDDLFAVDAATHEVTVATSDCCLSALTPLRDGNYLSAGTGAAVRFVSAAWDPLGTLLSAAPPTATCDTTRFTTLRLAPGGREVAVEARCDGQPPR